MKGRTAPTHDATHTDGNPMATISSSGLISGIDTDSLVSKLIALDAAPVSLLQTRITSDQTLGSAYSGLASQLTSLQTTAQSLEKPQAFQGTTANSSNPSVLTATTTTGAAVGSYTLRVARTVSTQQLVSGGFTDPTSAKVGAGTITIEEGSGGDLAAETPLSALNGGAGVGRGQFRITDRSGATAVIDTSSAVSLDDVVADINTATTIGVRASVSGDHLVLTDTSGQTASHLIVQDLGGGTSAVDLGIAGSAAANTITGTGLTDLSRSTLLAGLNDGRGVDVGSGGTGGDFDVNLSDGSSVAVNLAGATTVGDVIDKINAAGGGKVTAAVASGSAALTLTDNTGGGGRLSVTALNGSAAATQLGLTAVANGGFLSGSPVVAGLDSTLLSSLNGGNGLTLGSLTITDAAGSVHTVDLSAATDVQGVIDAINARHRRGRHGIAQGERQRDPAERRLRRHRHAVGGRRRRDRLGDGPWPERVEHDRQAGRQGPGQAVGDQQHAAQHAGRWGRRQQRHVHDHDGRRRVGQRHRGRERPDGGRPALPDQQPGRRRADGVDQRDRQRPRHYRHQRRGGHARRGRPHGVGRGQPEHPGVGGDDRRRDDQRGVRQDHRRRA